MITICQYLSRPLSPARFIIFKTQRLYTILRYLYKIAKTTPISHSGRTRARTGESWISFNWLMVYQCAGCNPYSSHTIGLLFWRGIPMVSLGGHPHNRDLLVYFKRRKLISRPSLRNRIVVMDFGLYTCRMARCYRPSPTFIVETGEVYLFLWFSFWVCLPAGRVLGWS